MKEILIFVEGGGDSAGQRAELRGGFERLLRKQKDAARNKGIGWKLVFCGSRNSAFGKFQSALQDQNDKALVLVVDSEGPLPENIGVDSQANAKMRVQYLAKRDGWSFAGIDPLLIHLMVQCMEAWIVADPDALAKFYGTSFRKDALPKRDNLEDEPKLTLYDKLTKATRATQKGAYSESNNAKVRHASKLLALVDPDLVARRCPHFATLTNWLDNQINPKASS